VTTNTFEVWTANNNTKLGVIETDADWDMANEVALEVRRNTDAEPMVRELVETLRLKGYNAEQTALSRVHL
jgi:hypothetical protein